MAFPVEDTQKAETPQAVIIPPPVDESQNRVTRYCPTLPEIGAKIGRAVWSGWSVAALAVALLAVVLAYQVRPVSEIKPGGGFDVPYLNLSENGFGSAVRVEALPVEEIEGESAGRTSASAATKDPASDKAKAPEEVLQDYRWTRERPILLLPGVGTYPTKLTLLASGSPLIAAGQQVEVFLNGAPFNRFELQPGKLRSIEYNLVTERFPGGNLTVEMRVTALGPLNEKLAQQYPGSYRLYDQREGRNFYEGGTGFKLYRARLEAQDGSGFTLPPTSVAMAFIFSGWLIYLGLAYCGLRRRWAFGMAAGLALVGGFILAFARLSLTIYTGRLALLLLVTVLLLPMLDWAVPRVLQSWKLPLPTWAWQGLMIMFVVGMVGRGGGVLYPQMEVIDAPAHLKEIRTVLYEPDGFWKEFRSKELSKVPAQWESDAIIPYSPFVFFYLSPVAALPIDPYISVNLLNTTLDALRVFIIFGLAAALGAGARVALLAAGLYLITPSTWLLNSWGNWPTTFSLWLGTLYVLLVLANWRKLWPVTWLGATFVLLLTMLGYTVTAVFMGLLLYGWAFGLVFVVGRQDKLARRNGGLIFGSATIAAALAVVIYYVQFIPDLARTLTSFGSSLNGKGSLGGFGDRTFDYYLGLYTNHVMFRYGAGAFILIALIVFGGLLFTKKPPPDEVYTLDTIAPNLTALRSPVNLWLYAAWILVFALFSLAQWKVDMVNKQVWFMLPLAVILAAVGLDWLLRRFQTPARIWVSRVAITALIFWTTYSALALWVERVFIKRR